MREDFTLGTGSGSQVGFLMDQGLLTLRSPTWRSQSRSGRLARSVIGVMTRLRKIPEMNADVSFRRYKEALQRLTTALLAD